MRRIARASLPPGVVALATLLFGAICARFVRQPGLGTFADDSVSYLIMAQWFSPWQAVSAPVAEAFAREATYPPLYPLLLAASGSAHDFGRAHLVSALLLAACLPVLYLLARAWLEHRGAAAAAALSTALLPAMWIQARGILSEPLFLLLFLLLLLALEPVRAATRSGKAVLCALLAALVLTRTVGLVIALAYGVWAFTRAADGLRSRLGAAAPALGALLAYGAWVLLRPGETADDYLRIIREHFEGPQTRTLGAHLARQALSMGEAWIGSVLLFWVEGRPLRVALAALIGVLALGGMALRMARGKADGWLAAAYLATFLAWPFYDQMTRFLFPVVPVLLLHAFYATRAALQAMARPPAIGYALLALLLASLTVPALGFIHERARAQGPQTAIVDWYRTPDLAQARARAQVHLDLEQDMRAISLVTAAQERVMWVTPAHIALLAGRHGLPAPRASSAEDFRRRVAAAGPDYLFLSRYHPRDTIRDAAWRLGSAAMLGHGELVRAQTRDDGELSSMLLKVAPGRAGR